MTSSDWLEHVEWLNGETVRLLEFGRASGQAAHGFAWLDAQGEPRLNAPLDLWITCRMTHVYALGMLLGHQWCAPLVDHGLGALNGAFLDTTHGGWYAQISPEGTPTDPTKTAYGHAFVVLAASSATAAGVPGARDVLKRALTNQNVHFREGTDGMVVDVFNREFTQPDPYRGANANMHTVEAYLAAGDITGDSRWHRRALAITERIVTAARDSQWRVPEHYTTDWTPLPEYNADQPQDQFRPYGSTPGHGFEWARLILELRAALGANAPAWMLTSAEELFRRAYLDGWVDAPTPGLVYTTDWSGRPVMRARLHWVIAEAAGAAITAYRSTGDPLYHHLYFRWWNLIQEHFTDPQWGSWHHELSPIGTPSTQLWEGKPDLYHAIQATLIPRLPLTPCLSAALANRLLDRV
ncbi:MAG: AGE family epimerase/isomerase [Bifidobacteriaceae bacterium]|jgi:mannose/cellobiose epimerase-like protein (N-acyl-D-glucosamine 2-epimerase family)|nr:AGE family epimerase/isomerase [Bifidobacteriaceae bacterium]